MKPVIIIAIAVGISVVTTVGIMLGIGQYNQMEYEKAINRIEHDFNLQQELARIEQEQYEEYLIASQQRIKEEADVNYKLGIQACQKSYLGQQDKLLQCFEGVKQTRQKAGYYP